MPIADSPTDTLLTKRHLFVHIQGHGDELVIADANFPAASIGACTAGGVVRCDGLSGTDVSRSVMKV